MRGRGRPAEGSIRETSFRLLPGLATKYDAESIIAAFTDLAKFGRILIETEAAGDQAASATRGTQKASWSKIDYERLRGIDSGQFRHNRQGFCLSRNWKP